MGCIVEEGWNEEGVLSMYKSSFCKSGGGGRKQ
jgi:hypothetical protein